MYIMQSEASQRPRLVSQTLIQDAIVLWVGEFPAPELKEEEEEPVVAPTSAIPPTPTPAVIVQEDPTIEVEEEKPVVVRPDVVTLVVEPQDAVTINYLLIMGADLNLVLRSAGDDSRITAETVTLQFILEQYNIPIPSKLPYGIEPRVDSFYNVTQPTPTPTSIVITE
jgi:pilus assembly protein CpaB